MKAQVGSLVSWIEANQQEMIAKMDAWVGKLEANQDKSDAVAKHQEVPNEEASVETIGALQDRHGDQHLAVVHRQRNGFRAMVDPSRSWPLAKDS
jgi:hypothetical protein